MNDDEEQVGAINWRRFISLAAIVVTIGAATYFLLPSLIEQGDSDVQIVKAIDGPIKVKPAISGGKTVDHQDLVIVDILRDSSKNDAQTETLRLASPSPEPPPLANPNQPKADAPKADAPKADTPKLDAPKLDAPKPDINKAKTVKKAVEPAKAAVPTVTKNSAEPVTKPAKLSTGITKRKIVIEGDVPLYMIQLAAFRSQEKAQEMAGILAEKHKSRIKAIKLQTMQVDTSTNGIFHRIVSAPLPRAEADAVCGILRRAGQDCFLRKFTSPSP